MYLCTCHNATMPLCHYAWPLIGHATLGTHWQGPSTLISARRETKQHMRSSSVALYCSLFRSNVLPILYLYWQARKSRKQQLIWAVLVFALYTHHPPTLPLLSCGQVEVRTHEFYAAMRIKTHLINTLYQITAVCFEHEDELVIAESELVFLYSPPGGWAELADLPEIWSPVCKFDLEWFIRMKNSRLIIIFI